MKKKVLILSGGISKERLISLDTGLQVAKELRKNRYKVALKKMNKLLEKKDLKEINKFFPTFQSELMKIAKTGVVKKENLSRKISRISRRIKKINK